MGSTDLRILHWPTGHILLVSVVRLGLAALLGAVIGFQRERVHSAAGLRTHMLVSVGAAFFVLATIQAGSSSADISRVIQGLTAGVGFLGAGAILKMGEKGQVHGLTTAASIWLIAAIGTGAGLGHLWLPLLGAAFGWLILGPVGRLEKHRSPPQT
jgi:putative Mg2+ transporter-C (MgtC) family protein